MLTNKTVTQATQPKRTQAAQSKTCMKCLGVLAVSRLAELSAARKLKSNPALIQSSAYQHM